MEIEQFITDLNAEIQQLGWKVNITIGEETSLVIEVEKLGIVIKKNITLPTCFVKRDIKRIIESELIGCAGYLNTKTSLELQKRMVLIKDFKIYVYFVEEVTTSTYTIRPSEHNPDDGFCLFSRNLWFGSKDKTRTFKRSPRTLEFLGAFRS